LSAKQSVPVEEPHLNLIPLGSLEVTVLSVIAANAQAILGLNTRILPNQPEPEYAFLARRGQYDAGKILRALTIHSSNVPFQLAVVGVDIYTPILTYVFGESQLGGVAAVISLFRLQSKNRNEAYNRAAKIALHEIGHLLGIVHCETSDCLMGFSKDLAKLDERPLRFCQACEYEAGRRLRHVLASPRGTLSPDSHGKSQHSRPPLSSGMKKGVH
jgi:archaemetzincin